MKRIRVGYVGCGGLAQLVHIPNLMAATDRCELLGIAEVRPKLAAQVAGHWRIPRVYRDHRALGADPDIEAVVLSGHWATQGDIAADLLEAGKHVLMEKPMAASLEQGERIVAAERRSGRRLMVAYMKRYDAGNVLLKETVAKHRADGSLGRLRYVRNQAILGDWMAGLEAPFFTSDEPYPQPTDHWPAWLPAAKRNGYFGYIQQYTHNVSFLRWLLDARPGTVRPRAVILDPQDDFSGLCVLDVDGLTTCIESGSTRCHEWNERTSLFFEGGTIESSMFTLLLKNVPSTVEIYRGNEAVKQRTELFPADGRTWAYKTELLHFLDRINDGQPFRSPAVDALEDVRLLEDIYRLHAGTAAAAVKQGAA